MAATKIILKRSSIPGKRPNTTNLEAGELAVNTNANEPGLFFEVTDGQVVKAGPTAYLPGAPTISPARGELWVDTDTKSLSIGNTLNEWQKVAAPYLGGTNALTVFVAPDFPEATDSLANDGQSVPFVTINRAVIEVTKQIILDANAGLSTGNNRYLIVLAPSRHCVVNHPGATLNGFSVNFNNPYSPVTQEDLAQFNPPDVGGLILPRGVSVIGLDLKKCEVRPVHVPSYTHPAFPSTYQQVTNGPVFANQPLSSIFKWSGNTYVSNFTSLDKIQERTVSSVGINADTGAALFRTSRPHGLDFNDFVRVDYTNEADQAGATFSEGAYFAFPTSSFEFQLSVDSWEATPAAVPVLATSLPANFQPPLDNGRGKFQVANIYPYFTPTDGVSYELSNYSHHRLSVFNNASLDDLNIFYQKVQKAFSTTFGGAVNKNVVTLPEYQIVADAQNLYPQNLNSNNTDNSSPYVNTVNLRSNYGMASIDADGELVTGFKSVIANALTAVSIQKDPAAYEIYSDSAQIWSSLVAYGQQQLGPNTPISSVPTSLLLSILNETAIPNIRYYYQTQKLENGQSTGLTDVNNDFRHFGIRSRGANSYLQTQSIYTIGTAVGAWALNGAIINLTSSTTNFGSNAFQAEGFAGIGGLGGSTQVSKGFLQSGVVRPLALTEPQVVADAQKRILSLGSRIVQVAPDPTNADVLLIYLRQAFDPASILPFSLRPGSAVFLSDSLCTYSAYFVDNGEPTVILSETDPILNPYAPGGAILRVRKSDANIPSSAAPDSNFFINSFPYIRRYIDPRTDTEKCYGFYVESTNPSSQAPQAGSVIRLNQFGKDLSKAFKRNYQFDPGQFGGIAQIFNVNAVETVQYNFSLNYNNKVSDTSQSSAYAVYASLGDASGPWIQSFKDANNVQVPYNTPEGSYITNNYRNFYAAENNLWVSLYYKTTFNAENGPTKVDPRKADSPFVPCAILERQEQYQTSWQGYVPDPFLAVYDAQVPADYSVNMTYLRGTIVPSKEFSGEYWIDSDDGSPGLGIIFTNVPLPRETRTTSSTVVVQSAQPMTSPFVANATFGRPEIVTFTCLEVAQFENPKNGVSVIELSSGSTREFLRVIGLASNQITAIRNYYPRYAQGTLPAVWPADTTLKVCVSSGTPEPSVYDPNWTVTKLTILRYYQLMGFDPSLILPFLNPQYAGERVLFTNTLPYSPINGYANLAAPYAIEFNNPSTILANNHTWTYAGYFDYSRGLPKYQTNELSRKVSADFQSFGLWGGRVTCFGGDDNGEMILSGGFREAFTLNYFESSSPIQNSKDRVVYASPAPIDFPAPILVYSCDDITSQFNGSQTVFALKRGGFNIPPGQLSTTGVFVFLGGVAQVPGQAYSVIGTDIIFTEAPLRGTCCDIRVITSDDNEKTLEIVSFSTRTPLDGVTSFFPLSPESTSLDNGNSFVFLGGVLQDPQGPPLQIDSAYTIDQSGNQAILAFIGAAPQSGTTLDVRGVLSGASYRTAGVPIVFMSSTDDISPDFNGTRRIFPLLITNENVDAYKINAENMFVNLGGVMQIPIPNVDSTLLSSAYSVDLNSLTQQLEITFAVAPVPGTTCNIRILHQDEFITCPLPSLLTDGYLRSGPGVETTATGELIGIDEGLVN